MEKVLKFKIFCNKFPYLDIQESIIYFAIFDGHPLLGHINLSGDFSQTIQNEIIEKIEILKKYFIYD
ncbi:MAG: hypothetical protein L3J44_08025 [Campylobacteraceae bacterium]|nr:hypothetical protein [Campylobacteraceae bacterium]